MPKCPNCQSEITLINRYQDGQIEFSGNIKRDGWWPMQDNEWKFQCPECDIPFDSEDLDKLGVPTEMR